MNKTTAIWMGALGLTAAAAFFVGRALVPSGNGHGEHDHQEEEAKKETVWTCSMHPQVRQPEPGTCPICAMDLIPLSDDDDGEDQRDLPVLRLSERAVALMNIRTAPVERREAHAEIRLPGVVAVDETRRAVLSAWFDGRIDRLYVDATGIQVKRGEHLAEFYSPQLYGAQEEFLQALRASRQSADSMSGELAEAARTKLILLGLSGEQIDTIAREDRPTTNLTYHSPFEGTVLERKVTSGQYVQTGTPLYTVADLSRVWVNLEAFESDLGLLRFGQEIGIEVSAFPGQIFTGRIAYIDPEVDPVRRTARVRAHLNNERRQLKPGMLATGTARARVGEGGMVTAGHLAGKWISPMHPEIVKDGPGECDVCGMDLVPVEEMGFFADSAESMEDPLVIPASAPLLTGKRAVVYVRVPNGDRPVFEARQVVLGRRLGDVHAVESGLREGDLVVVHGQFKIDSELQIRGRPGMMSPPPEGDAEKKTVEDPREPPRPADFAGDVDSDFGRELIPLYDAYLDLVGRLADDDPGGSVTAVAALRAALEEIGQHRLSGTPHEEWMGRYDNLGSILENMAGTFTLENIRGHLQALTTVMEQIYVDFGGGRLPVLKRAHCPMVEGGVEIDGAPIGTWLQREEPLANPYWGAAMLRCGEFHGELG